MTTKAVVGSLEHYKEWCQKNSRLEWHYSSHVNQYAKKYFPTKAQVKVIKNAINKHNKDLFNF